MFGVWFLLAQCFLYLRYVPCLFEVSEFLLFLFRGFLCIQTKQTNKSNKIQKKTIHCKTVRSLLQRDKQKQVNIYRQTNINHDRNIDLSTHNYTLSTLSTKKKTIISHSTATHYRSNKNFEENPCRSRLFFFFFFCLFIAEYQWMILGWIKPIARSRRTKPL